MANVEIPSYKRLTNKSKTISKKETVMPKVGIDDVTIGIISFLISRVAIINGQTPFGLAFTASGFKSKKAAFAFIGTCLGLFTVHHDTTAVKYILALLIFAVCKFFIKKESVYINTAVISSSLFFGGFVFSLASYMLTYDLLLLTLECFVCGFFTLAFKGSADYVNLQKYFSYITNEQLLSMTLSAALALCGLGSTVNIGAINLCQILCSVIIMVLAQNRGATFGACAGVAAGVVCALGKSNIMSTVGLFALSGFASGSVKNLGKSGVAAGFLLSGSATFFLTGENLFNSGNVLNMMLGTTVFMSLPKKVNEKIKMFTDGICIEPDEIAYIKKAKMYVAERLNCLSDTYSRLSEAVVYEDTNKNSNETEIKALNHAFVKVCTKCGLKNICWDKEKTQTLKMFEKLDSSFFKNGYMEKNDFPADFKKKCVNFSEFAYYVNHYYGLNHINKLWQKQIINSRNLISEQYKEFSEILDKLNFEFSYEFSGQNEYEDKFENKILNALYQIDIYAFSVCVKERERGYFNVEIKFETNDYVNFKNEIVRTVSEILQTDMNIVDVNTSANKLYLEPIYRFLPLCASASVKKDKNDENGDSIIKETMHQSRFFISVSDGMGTGKEAAYQSRKTAEILKELLNARYSCERAVKTLNSALAAGGGEVFSTVDSVVINLTNGEADFVKIGAMPSFIIDKNGTQSVFCANMPIGILNNVNVKSVTKKLKKDDILIMFSDGVSDLKRGYEWIASTAFEIQDKNPDDICEILLKEAIIRNHGKINDDMSFVVFKLKENL